MPSSPPTDPVRSRPTPWTTVILMCGKCARKMNGGYGADGKDSLRAALRAELKERQLRRGVRIIETRCLGVCPKRAVVTINATRPDRVLIIPKRTSAATALTELGALNRQTPPDHA